MVILDSIYEYRSISGSAGCYICSDKQWHLTITSAGKCNSIYAQPGTVRKSSGYFLQAFNQRCLCNCWSVIVTRQANTSVGRVLFYGKPTIVVRITPTRSGVGNKRVSCRRVYVYTPGTGFMKPCALLKLGFLTSAYNKCIALVRKSSFSKAQGLYETGPWGPLY